MEPILTVEDLYELLGKHFPQVNFGTDSFHIDKVESGRSVVRLNVSDSHLRPGGTVSGPTMMELADLAAYVVVLAHIGPEVLAVTSNLNISFLRKPQPGAIICDSELIKLGQRLAVVDCSVRSDASQEIVAKAIITYALPQKMR